MSRNVTIGSVHRYNKNLLFQKCKKPIFYFLLLHLDDLKTNADFPNLNVIEAEDCRRSKISTFFMTLLSIFYILFFLTPIHPEHYKDSIFVFDFGNPHIT